MDVNDSEEIESEEEEDRMNMDEQETAAQNKNVGPQHKGVPKRAPEEDEDDDDDEKEVPGAYNP